MTFKPQTVGFEDTLVAYSVRFQRMQALILQTAEILARQPAGAERDQISKNLTFMEREFLRSLELASKDLLKRFPQHQGLIAEFKRGQGVISNQTSSDADLPVSPHYSFLIKDRPGLVYFPGNDTIH